MRWALQTKFALFAMLAGILFAPAALAQAKQASPPPAQSQKGPAVGPPAPQSKHYPILLLAFGNTPDWNLRIGLKGPERFDRFGYPPIPLEPADVIHETAADTWTYHAKDSATGAVVAVHLTRQPCTDAMNDTLTTTPPVGGRYSFRVSVEHAQIGSLNGCARIATELFPKINNQPDQQDDTTKKKPPVPVSTVTKFQSPTAVAYGTFWIAGHFDAAGQLIFKRGKVTRAVSNRPSSGLSVSHDGKRLLFTGEEAPGPIRTLYEYNFDTSSKRELIRANVHSPLWSPDDKRIAFLKRDNSTWSVWIMPSDISQPSSKVFSAELMELYGWPEDHTILAGDYDSLLWVSDSGSVLQRLPFQEIFGSGYRLARVDSFRLNPRNPDLLLASFWYIPSSGESPLDKHEGNSPALILYEVKSKRRVSLLPHGTWAEYGEWSRDGMQIFFTGRDPTKPGAVYRVFWDGIGLQKYISGTDLVVGQ